MPGHKKNLTDQLKQLQEELIDLSARNPLVHTPVQKLWYINDPGSAATQARKIYQSARHFEKEYGLKTTLLVHSYISWNVPGTKDFITSICVYQPCSLAEKIRTEQIYSYEISEEQYFINPALRKAFANYFKLELPEYVDEPDTFYSIIQKEFNAQKEAIASFADITGNKWCIHETFAIGNFNYRKSRLYDDYEKINEAPGTLLSHLLLHESPATSAKNTSSLFRHELDESQQRAIAQAMSQSCVIQGPPGTGKSHTVAVLIKSLLAQNKNILFVSEKRSALEVVYERLKKDKLDHLVAYFDTKKDERKSFYAHLKKTWSKATGTAEKPIQHGIPSNFEGNDLFSFYPQKLKTTSPSAAVSIHSLEEKLMESGYSSPDLHFSGATPPFEVWCEFVELLFDLEKIITSAFRIDITQEAAFIALSGIIFNEPSPLVKLDKTLHQIRQTLNVISDLQKKYGLKGDLDDFTRIAIAGSILGMVNKNQLELVKSDHKHFKSFNTLAKKYELTKNKLTQAEQVTKKWRKKPSISEITEISGRLKNQKKKKTILGILKRNSSPEIDWFVGFARDLSTSTKLHLLEELRTEWHLRGELEAIKIKLKHDLQISDPDNEINHILQARSKLDLLSQNEYITVLEHEQSLDLIAELIKVHPEISRLNSQLHYLFHSGVTKNSSQLHTLISRIQEELPLMAKYQHEVQLYFTLPSEITSFLRAAQKPVHQLDAIMTFSQLLIETRFLPAYKTITGDALLTAFNQRQKKIKSYSAEIHELLGMQPSVYIHHAEKLLATSTTKLKPADKKIRQSYKEEKRTLLHELKKTKQHLAVKSLQESCPALLRALQPVWMMNPLSVAQHLPCESEYFDVVIFDEASQVPLEDAIPAIYRGAQLIVVGDDQQMPPSQFFMASADGKTLLDQASISLQSTMLKWHYRSQHPSLISFSNRTFYDHELITFPPVSDEPALIVENVEGIFEDNKNSAEAIAVAKRYQALLKTGQQDIGIIAFSKEQQDEIEKQINKLKLPPNELLMIRNLENVQGIEKEVVLVSIGYAKNKEGQFRKNFGPVNQEKGANRLNVLFTRAIKKMIVFASVTSADFSLSENRGVTILGDFLRYAETAAFSIKTGRPEKIAHRLVERILAKNKISYSFYTAENGLVVNCFVDHTKGLVLLVDPCIAEEEPNDLFAVLEPLKRRFNKIMIVVSAELLNDQARVERDIIKFFTD